MDTYLLVKAKLSLPLQHITSLVTVSRHTMYDNTLNTHKELRSFWNANYPLHWHHLLVVNDHHLGPRAATCNPQKQNLNFEKLKLYSPLRLWRYMYTRNKWRQYCHNTKSNFYRVKFFCIQLYIKFLPN